MLLFRSEEHIERWCGAREIARGATLTPEQGWRLARLWYEDRLRPDWQVKTAERAQGLLAQVGLTSPFWALRR